MEPATPTTTASPNDPTQYYSLDGAPLTPQEEDPLLYTHKDKNGKLNVHENYQSIDHM